MKYYFVEEFGKKNGPFTIEELKSKRLSNKSLVWTEGLQNWTEAEMVDEIRDVIIINPPPLPSVFEKDIENKVIAEKYFINTHKLKSTFQISIIISLLLTFFIAKVELESSVEKFPFLEKFPIYMSIEDRETPFWFWLKFLSFIFLIIFLCVFIYKFIIKKVKTQELAEEYKGKKTQNYNLKFCELQKVNERGMIKVFFVEFKSKHSGHIYKNLSTNTYFFYEVPIQHYENIDDCINHFHSHLIKKN